MSARPKIPIELARRVKVEAGHRCAIPICGVGSIDIAHIVPWRQVKEHKFENLIVLCSNHHRMYDKDKKIDRQSMLMYKANLGLLNNRYGEVERRILHWFLGNPTEVDIILPSSFGLMVYNLVKDGLLFKANTNSDIQLDGISLAPYKYQLTDKGKDFITNWQQGMPLD